MKKVVNIYIHIISLFALFVCGSISRDLVLIAEKRTSGNTVLESMTTTINSAGLPFMSLYSIIGLDDTLICILCVVLIEVFLVSCVSYLLSLNTVGRISLLAFVCPAVAKFFDVQVASLAMIHNTAAYFILLSCVLYMLDKVGIIVDDIKHWGNVMYAVFLRYGWLETPFHLWNRYKMSAQLLLLWTGIFCVKLFTILSNTNINKRQIDEHFALLLLRAISETCSSPLTVLALCIVVCYLSSAVLIISKIFLLGMEGFHQDAAFNHGWTEGLTFLLVVVQTNLTDMDPHERRNLFIIVLFIIFSTLLESIHDILNPHLLGLAAAFNKSVLRHARAIFLATCLWICPIYMTVFLSRMFSIGFWLMIIISSCLLTSIQVISTLLIYAIFIYDHFRSEPSNNLDDLIFYIKTTVRFLEFIVALVVVTFGVKEIFYGNWNIVSTAILCVHFYFNVWKRIQAGWEGYLMRRAALRRLEVLPEASEAELRELNDVCPICFSEMKAARKTECNHYFHAVCLRKWLYIRDYCPMCQRKMSVPSGADGSDSHAERDPAHQIDDNADDDFSLSSSDSEVYDDQNVDLGVYLDEDHDRDVSSGEEITEGEGDVRQ